MSNIAAALPVSLLVASGGAAGALARYHLGRVALHWAGPGAVFPWSTFAVNLLGCLAMGALMGLIARMDGAGEALRLLIGVGLLGGFTTFSAFSLEMVLLIERGHAGLALLYAAGSLAGGVLALALGLMLARGSL